MGLDGLYVILGIAAVWSERKGLKDILKLSELLPSSHKIILVGLSKEQLKKLPQNVVGIPSTNSIEKLREIYSISDAFINPTYQDNYPTTNLEAIACGTPVFSYATGGSGESASLYGKVIPTGMLKPDIFAAYSFNIKIPETIRLRINKEYMIQQYLHLYG